MLYAKPKLDLASAGDKVKVMMKYTPEWVRTCNLVIRLNRPLHKSMRICTAVCKVNAVHVRRQAANEDNKMNSSLLGTRVGGCFLPWFIMN